METEISSDIPLENRRSSFSKCKTELLLLESKRGWAAKGLDSLAQLNKPDFSDAAQLPLLLTPWIWYAFHAEIDLGQERWRERVCTVIGRERGCCVPEPLPTPVPCEKAPSARSICQSPSAFQDYDALWFYSFLLEVLLKYKQHSISAGIKEIQIKNELRNSPNLQAHFKAH